MISFLHAVRGNGHLRTQAHQTKQRLQKVCFYKRRAKKQNQREKAIIILITVCFTT